MVMDSVCFSFYSLFSCHTDDLHATTGKPSGKMPILVFANHDWRWSVLSSFYSAANMRVQALGKR